MNCPFHNHCFDVLRDTACQGHEENVLAWQKKKKMFADVLAEFW